MKNPKHTKGEWLADVRGENASIFTKEEDSTNGRDIAQVEGFDCEANAKLMAAAPDMLGELKHIEFLIDKDQPIGPLTLRSIKAAIKKATA